MMLIVARRAARAAGVALALASSLGGPHPALAAPALPPGPKPLDPRQVVKSADGYFDEVFALDSAATRVAVIRTDGATFAKLEVVDLATGKTATSCDLPDKSAVVDRLELLADGHGVILVSRGGIDGPPALTATLLDPTCHALGKAGPVTAFGRPAAESARAPGKAPDLLIAFDRKPGEGGGATYSVAPHHLATLAPAGKPRTYHAGPAGEIKSPSFRLLGFLDGYGRAIGERPGAYDKKNDVRAPAHIAMMDTLKGTVVDLGDIADVMGWAAMIRLRLEHPGRSRFAALNQDESAVDVVDAMGKKQAAELAIPMRVYDSKSLHDQEGPEPDALTFSLTVDPTNPDAVKRKRTDMPMLDLYAFDAGKGAPKGATKLRGRVFAPHPVLWRVAQDKLVVLKRFKSFTRGGDELQIYDLH